MDDISWKLDHYSLKPLTPPPHHTVESSEMSYQDYSLVITGDVFRWMLSYAPLETVQRVCKWLFALIMTDWRILDAGEDPDFCQDVSR